MATDEGESTRRGPMHARRVTVIAAMVTVALGSLGALSWSLIPVGIHGRVTGVGYQSDSGLRWRIIGFSDGPDRVVDKSLVDALGGRHRLIGQRLEKQPFSATVTVDSHPMRLTVSPTSWLVVAVLTVVVAFAVLRMRLRSVAGDHR